jgi:nucleotide-binding universal stress UspA family protein
MNIVLGIDGSECSRVAAELVAGMGWPSGTHVRLVAAYESPVDWVGVVPEAALLESRDEDVRAELTDALDEQAARLRARGYVTESIVRRGRAATVLLAVADEAAADQIVVGSRGHGVAATALLGSVSATLVDHAHCPVLVARRAEVRRMLVAADGSPSAQAIPQILAGWQAFRGIPTEVVTVAPAPPVLPEAWSALAGLRATAVHRPADPHESFRMTADSEAHRLTALGIPSTGRVLVGDPARTIEAAAGEREVDLVVTGSRGIGDLQRFLLGSVAHHVLLNARCSVLIMRGHVPARIAEREPALFVQAT